MHYLRAQMDLITNPWIVIVTPYFTNRNKKDTATRVQTKRELVINLCMQGVLSVFFTFIHVLNLTEASLTV